MQRSHFLVLDASGRHVARGTARDVRPYVGKHRYSITRLNDRGEEEQDVTEVAAKAAVLWEDYVYHCRPSH